MFDSVSIKVPWTPLTGRWLADDWQMSPACVCVWGGGGRTPAELNPAMGFPAPMAIPAFFSAAGPSLPTPRCRLAVPPSFRPGPWFSCRVIPGRKELAMFISRFISQSSYLIPSLPPRRGIVEFPFNTWGNGRSKKVHVLPVYSQQPSALELSFCQSPFGLAFPFILKAQHVPLLQEQADQMACFRRTQNGAVPVRTPRPVSLLTPCI